MNNFKKNFIINIFLWSVLAEITSPGHFLYFLSFFLYIPFFYSLKNYREKWFFISLTFGILYNLIYFRWLIYPFQYSNIPLFFAFVTLLLLAFALSCFLIIFGYIFLNYKNIFLLSSAFVSLEILKGIIFTGFPWGDLSYNFYKFKFFLNIASYFGSYLVTFIIISLNLVIFRIIFEKKYFYFTYIFCIFLIIIFFNINYKNENFIKKKIIIVQGNIPEEMKLKSKNAEFIIKKYATLTLNEVKKDRVDLIIWPETIYTKFIYEDKNLYKIFTDFLTKVKTPVILGIPSLDVLNDNRYKIYNSMYLFYKPDKFLRYDKVHLVPFGEYTPLKKVLGFVNKLVPGEDFSKGNNFKIITYKEFKIIPLICFEGIFPFQILKLNKLRGNVIVNISNEAWFGNSYALIQHLAANVFRAVESNKFFLKSSNTGISAVISPKGKILKYIPPFKEGVIKTEIYLNNRVSFYHKYGYFLNYLYLVILLSMFIYRIFSTKRRYKTL